ncbi:MAG: hypothetical protein J6Y08_07170 [Clostridiales bacterium]|nr:hypothetical protein [Clostridiales bacterium]
MRYKIETERADLFDVGMVITMSVDAVFSEVPSDEKIQKAFALAIRSHEVLNTKVVIDPDGKAFYEPCEKPGSTISPTTKNLEHCISENEGRRFHIDEGEYIRAYYLFTPGKNTFIFQMHHLGGDGKSLLYFIESFFFALSGNEDLDKIPFKNTTTEDLPKNSKMPFFYKILIRRYNKMWEKDPDRRVFTFDDMQKAYEKFWNINRTAFSEETIEGEEFDALLQEAHESRASITALLTAKIVGGHLGRDMGEAFKEKANIGYAVDARELFPNRGMGNQATGISIDYLYKEDDSIAENARNILRLLKKKLDHPKYRYFILHFMAAFDPTLVDAVCLEYTGVFHSKTSEKLRSLLGYDQEKTRDMSITNLTRADIKDHYEGPENTVDLKDLTFLPPIVSYAKNVFGIVTLGKRLSITRHTFKR